MNRAIRGAALTLAAMGFVPMAEAAGQLVPKQFSVTSRVGGVIAERAASLEPSGVIGVDAEYAFSRYFGVGTSLDVIRGNTTSQDFPVRLRFGLASSNGGDTLVNVELGQTVNTINIGAFGTLRYPGTRVSPFLLGGIGTYALLTDPQISRGRRSTQEVSYTGGVGVFVRLGQRVGVQLDARSLTYTNFDRDALNPAVGRAEQNTPFPEDFQRPPAAKRTVLNTQYTLGFRYIPGGVGGN